MYAKQTASYFFVSSIVIAFLGILSGIAAPQVSQMVANSQAQDREIELYQIQTAVSDMLYQSICGQLEPVGPASDMSQVHTRDICPLVLSDYLVGVKLDSGCSYSFAADGTVVQVAP
jgi:type II secretory pathway pseudopilin PulG